MSIKKTVKYYGVMKSDDIRIRFGQNLKKYRLKKKLTQQQLADLTGIEYKYIQRLESKAPPAVRIDTIQRLSKSLDIEANKLL